MVILISTISISFIIYLFSRYWHQLSTRKVEYSRYLDKKRAYLGEEVTITTEIVNKKLLPLPWISIYSIVPTQFVFLDSKTTRRIIEWKSEYTIVTSLLFYEKVKRKDIFYCNERGYYSIYGARVKIGDLFGFTYAEEELKLPISLIVYPRIKPLNELIVPKNTHQGDISVKRWIMPDPVQVVGSREYTSSDSFNTIDWKSTARLGSLQVKKFDYTSDPSLMIFMDIQTEKIYWRSIDSEAIELGIEISAAIMQNSLENKIPVGLCANSMYIGCKTSVFIEPSISKNQRRLILDSLAMTSYHRGTDMQKLLREKAKVLKKENVIVLVTAYISEGLVTELNLLSKRGYKVKVILTKKCDNIRSLDKRIELLDGSKEPLAS